MKVFLDMVGCRLNQSEIERIASSLTADGGEVVADPEAADYIIVNTCCVTAKASADSRKMIRKYRRETGAKVISTGCWATVFTDEAADLVEPTLVFDNQSKDQIREYFKKTGSRSESKAVSEVKPALGHRSRTRSFIKIQDGCDNYCTYCLTRIARGPSRSIPAELVIADISRVQELGGKEAVLTGVQLGSWGKDLRAESKLSQLLKSILEKTQIPRIRISSIEPWDIDSALLECWKNERLCPHLHIPLQSGSDEILHRMGRPTTGGNYRELIAEIRQAVPEMAVTTDIMVGFPGETEELFKQSFEFVRSLGFSGGQVFKFSPMPGTAAAGFPNQVSTRISAERSHKFLQLFQQAAVQKRNDMLGGIEPVLWENNENNPDKSVFSGCTRNFTHVKTHSAEDISNKIKLVNLNELDASGNLFGTLIS
ncbi:MAG: tRNA (N(6)-L-threonylcarbamoyladenosine(37)-C(2))-methylthiotransferase MtaB [Anaerolineaceae bacterium]